MPFTQAQLPAQFTALVALTGGQYNDLVGFVSSFVGVQVGNYAFACACSHVLEMTLRGSFGGGVGPVSSLSGLDTSISWAGPSGNKGMADFWHATAWGTLYLRSRLTLPRTMGMVAT